MTQLQTTMTTTFNQVEYRRGFFTADHRWVPAAASAFASIVWQEIMKDDAFINVCFEHCLVTTVKNPKTSKMYVFPAPLLNDHLWCDLSMFAENWFKTRYQDAGASHQVINRIMPLVAAQVDYDMIGKSMMIHWLNQPIELDPDVQLEDLPYDLQPNDTYRILFLTTDNSDLPTWC